MTTSHLHPEIRVLGTLELRVDGEVVSPGGDARRAILATLAIQAGSTVSFDALADAAWGDEAVERDRGTLQVHIHNLRRRLGPSGAKALLTEPSGYRIDPSEVELDVLQWSARLDAARGSMDRAEHELAAAHFKQALALVRGAVLADLDVPALEAHQRHWSEEVLAVREEWVDAELAAGRHATMIGTIRKLVDENPLREHLWAQLMLALYRSGRQAEALDAYQEARTVLVEELGLDPGPALQHLEESILLQSAGLELARSSAAVHWLDAAGVPQRCPLVTGSALRVGRGSDADVNPRHDPMVSRRHARFDWDGASWTVADEGSVNGTILNGREIDGPTPVKDGDVVRCGETLLVVVTLTGDRDASRRSENLLRNTLRRSHAFEGGPPPERSTT